METDSNMSENENPTSELSEMSEVMPIFTPKYVYFTCLENWINLARDMQKFYHISECLIANQMLMQQYPENEIYQTNHNNNFRMIPSETQTYYVVMEPNNNNIALRYIYDFFGILSQHEQISYLRRHGGYTYEIAPFWKRAVAEAIDIFLWLLLKMVVLFVFVDIFTWSTDYKFEEIIWNELNNDNWKLFTAYLSALIFSSKVLIMELISKTLNSLYEAAWLRKYGATPGKQFMNLKVLHVEAVVPMQRLRRVISEDLGLPERNNRRDIVQGYVEGSSNIVRALVSPGTKPEFIRAFFRTIFKSCFNVLLLPIFIMYYLGLKENRTIVDIFFKTVVVVKGTRQTFP